MAERDDALEAAWRRVAARLRGSDVADGPAALGLLADIEGLRRALDRAELSAVRAARRHRTSWAEIATELGVSRQSAWERWRDLDLDVDRPAGGRDEGLDGTLGDAVDGLVGETAATVADAVAAPVASGRARRSLGRGVVPDVIGLGAESAGAVLRGAGFVPVLHDPGDARLPLAADATGTVTDQVPRGGTRRRGGSQVTVWLTRGGGGAAGVREPRRPSPTPRQARGVADPVDG